MVRERCQVPLYRTLITRSCWRAAPRPIKTMASCTWLRRRRVRPTVEARLLLARHRRASQARVTKGIGASVNRAKMPKLR